MEMPAIPELARAPAMLFDLAEVDKIGIVRSLFI
jgi:hypothetical protein